ncbi:MAG: hypothetical protein GX969_07640 [Firmicutes bacterium]|nr:hypothetical protein [Bacillota bacterium]
MLIGKLRLAAISCVVLVSLIAGLVPCYGAGVNVKDVPKEHWAYQSVKLLVDKGYLGLYGDGTFQGTKPVDRYTLAVVIARVLSEIDSGRIGATPEDIELLRRLSGEFREELVLIGTELDIFKKTIDEHDKARQVTKEDIARLTFTQREMKAEADKIISEIIGDVERLSLRVTQMENELTQSIADTHELAYELGSDLELLKIEANAHEEKLGQIRENLGAATLKLTSLESDVVGMEKDIADISLVVREQADEIISSRNAIDQLGEEVSGLSSKFEIRDENLTQDLDDVRKKTLSLEDALKSERDARVSTYTSLESGLTDLSSDFAIHKAQTSRELDGLRKENGLLKVLLGLVAVLGIVIK